MVERLKGDIGSLTHFLAVTVIDVTNALDGSQNQRPGKTFGWKADGRRVAGVGYDCVTSLLAVGSSRMCCERPFGVFNTLSTVTCCSAIFQRNS